METFNSQRVSVVLYLANYLKKGKAEILETNNRENEPLHFALFLEGWLEYNRQKWRIQPFRAYLVLGGSDSAVIDTVLFLNTKGPYSNWHAGSEIGGVYGDDESNG
ncbi:MAG: hypothetical protein WCI75_00260 [candidate division NC10 bacterium]